MLVLSLSWLQEPRGALAEESGMFQKKWPWGRGKSGDETAQESAGVVRTVEAVTLLLS